MATTLNHVNPTLLPATVTGPIFTKAVETSAVMSLARRVPLSMDANTSIPVPMDVPAAGWVEEGARKPVGSGSVGTKIMTGKKVALLVPVSSEVVRTNPAGLFDQLQQDLPTSIARAFDHAAIHGKDLRTGGAGPFADYMLQTPNSVELGTASQATGGVYTDLVNAEKLVVDGNYDFSGWAADPRLRPTLKLSTDTQGRPIWVDDPASGLNAGNLIGYPAFYNRGVSGNYRRSGNKVQVITQTGSATGGSFVIGSNGSDTLTVAFNAAAATVQAGIRAWGGAYAAVAVTGSAGGPFTATFPTTGAPITIVSTALTGGTTPAVVVAQSPDSDTGLRAVGGDFSQCAYGVGMEITMKRSDTASYVDENDVTHSAFQENLELLLIEAYFGFVVGDTRAFVAATDAA